MRLRWPSILLIAIITILFIVFNIYGFLELLRFFRLRQEKKLIEWQNLQNSPQTETSTYNREIFSNDINEEEEDVEETATYRSDIVEKVEEKKEEEIRTTETPETTTTTTTPPTTFSTSTVRSTFSYPVETTTTRRPYTWYWSPRYKSTTTTVTPPTTSTTTTTEQTTRPVWTTTRSHIGFYREHDRHRVHHEKSRTSTTTPTTTTTTMTTTTTPSTTSTTTTTTTTTIPTTTTPTTTSTRPTSTTSTTTPTSTTTTRSWWPATSTTRIRVTTNRYPYQHSSSPSASSPYERITIPSSSSYRTPYVHRFETSSSSSSSLPSSSTSQTTNRRYWVPEETRTITTSTINPFRHHPYQHHFQHHHHHHHNRTHIDVHAHIRPYPQYPPPYQLPNVIYPSRPPSTTTEETTTRSTTMSTTTTSETTTTTVPQTGATHSIHHQQHHQHHHHHNNHNHSHIQHVHSNHHHQHQHHPHISTTTQRLDEEIEESTTTIGKDIEEIEIEAIGDIVSTTIAERTEQPRGRQRQPEPPLPELKSEERDATLVTGFLDIGRGEWFQYRRPLEKYHEFMENILSLDNYLVVFTDNSTSEFVRKYRKNMGLIHKTVVHEISLQDLPLYGYINEARRIIEDELKNETFYTHVGDRDMRTHPEAISAEYNIVVNSKTHFLHNVTMDNPFNTEHFIWLDAGYGHGNENYFPYNNMWRPKFPDGKISLIKVTPEYDVLSTYNLDKLYRKNWAVLSGGFIAGDKHSIGQLHSIVHRKFIQLIYQNYVDDDQTLLVLAVNAHPHLFHIIQGDWFDAFRLFSVDPEVQLG